MTELIRKQAENSAENMKEPGALADQSLAALVMYALLLHERERINLLDHDTVLPEATRRPKSIRPLRWAPAWLRRSRSSSTGEPPAACSPTSINGSEVEA